MDSKQRVGVIGLGKMGGPIAARIAAAGYAVSGFDLDREAREAVSRQGVEIRSSVREVAEASDGTIVLVGSEEAAEQICLGDEHGLLVEGKTVIVCSTVTAELIHRVADKAKSIGADLIDVPMARGEAAARSGNLLLLASGERAAFDRWKHVLSSFGSDVAYLGAAGAGQIAKTINNYLLWAAIVATHEGLRLAKHHDIEMDSLIEALLTSSGANYALQTWKMARDMPWAEKDMAITVRSFEQAGVMAPLAHTVEDTITALKAGKMAWQGSRTDISMDEYLRGS